MWIVLSYHLHRDTQNLYSKACSTSRSFPILLWTFCFLFHSEQRQLSVKQQFTWLFKVKQSQGEMPHSTFWEMQMRTWMLRRREYSCHLKPYGSFPTVNCTRTSWQGIERDLWAAKAMRVFSTLLTTSSTPWGAAALLCGPKSPSLPRAWAWGVALKRQLKGCLSKPAQRNHFWGEILALQLSSTTPAGAEDLEEGADRTDMGRELSLGF